LTQPAPLIVPSPRLPKQALLQLVATLSGCQVLWRTDAAPAVPGIAPGTERARIWIRVSSFGEIGVDEERELYNVNTGMNELLNIGQRQFTLSCRAEGFTPQSQIEPYDLLERVRFRMRTETAKAIFAPANLSLRDIQPMISSEMRVDNRMIPFATMDIRWNWVAIWDPNPDNELEGNWIQTVDVNNVVPGTLLNAV
jgi:hypothetical protein